MHYDNFVMLYFAFMTLSYFEMNSSFVGKDKLYGPRAILCALPGFDVSQLLHEQKVLCGPCHIEIQK